MALSTAGAITSAVTWTILVSLPLGGYLAERMRSPDRVMIGCFMLLGALIAALPLGAPPLIICILIGLLSGPPPGLSMHLPAEALRPENRSAGMGGVLYLLLCCHGGSGPCGWTLKSRSGKNLSRGNRL